MGNIVKYIVILVLGVALLLVGKGWQLEQEKRATAERNITALTSEITTYQDAAGRQVAEIQGLELFALLFLPKTYLWTTKGIADF